MNCFSFNFNGICSNFDDSLINIYKENMELFYISCLSIQNKAYVFYSPFAIIWCDYIKSRHCSLIMRIVLYGLVKFVFVVFLSSQRTECLQTLVIVHDIISYH